MPASFASFIFATGPDLDVGLLRTQHTTAADTTATVALVTAHHRNWGPLARPHAVTHSLAGGAIRKPLMCPSLHQEEKRVSAAAVVPFATEAAVAAIGCHLSHRSSGSSCMRSLSAGRSIACLLRLLSLCLRQVAVNAAGDSKLDIPVLDGYVCMYICAYVRRWLVEGGSEGATAVRNDGRTPTRPLPPRWKAFNLSEHLRDTNTEQHMRLTLCMCDYRSFSRSVARMNE
eukprot:GHVU01017234.1.p1 GENE.GHVU01017234.1~~GHVU01017234.1.p1  ORF type:complete len:230 (-),score=14.54 GHVU01017234.1:74-763(-)